MHCRTAVLPLFLLTPLLYSQQFPEEPAVAHLTLEPRACSSTAKPPAPLVCHSGLAGNSAGNHCLFGANYINNQEDTSHQFIACAQDCLNPNLKLDPGADCKNPNECFLTFSGQMMWRSANDLSSADQSALRALYNTLLKLVAAQNNSALYTKLGGDPARLAAKQSIVQLVFTKMTPYMLQCAQAHGVAIPFNIFGHHNAYANSNGGAMSSGINAQGGWMDIYEASFYGPQTNPVPQPNVLAAAFIHEWVHWNQPYYGWPEPKYNVRPYSGIFFPPGDVEVDLNELMAYDRSSISTFYKLALTPQEFSELVTQPRSIYISKFAQDWAKLNPAEKKAIANWAWSRPDGFMRRMMYGFPAEDGGAWGALCTANTGTGPCGMVH